MASADFPPFVVTAAFAVGGTSSGKNTDFLSITAVFTSVASVWLLDFTLPCTLVRHRGLRRFLFVGPEICYRASFSYWITPTTLRFADSSLQRASSGLSPYRQCPCRAHKGINISVYALCRFSLHAHSTRVYYTLVERESMPMTSSLFDPVQIPANVSVSSTKGYVYFNETTEWVPKKNDPNKKHATHKKVIIGKALIIGPNWKDDRRMVPNSNYFHLFEKDKIPEQPLRADNVSVGVYAAVKKVACDSGLREELLKVFQEEETDLILDLAMYMLTEESAVFQHFPHWGRSHAIFSGSVRSDSYISRFQKESISLSKINQFKEFWAKRAIDDGKLERDHFLN